MDRDSLFVTRPALPPLDELEGYLEQMWSSRILTNGGDFHRQFESALQGHLEVSQVTLTANATLGLIVALKQLQLQGEVITTPYSFVATAHAIAWSGATPVFADIDPLTLNIDPQQIERHITDRTTAILAVHCYGRPCDVVAIEAIAARHKLRVIYDAAHAFGVRDRGGSILRHGDLSVLSFHATKVFNTFEGGAIISRDPATKRSLDSWCNFGFSDGWEAECMGLNAKMNEFSAALGLVQLRHIDESIRRREVIDRRYRECLGNIPGLSLTAPAWDYTANFYSFPIFVDEPFLLSRDELWSVLHDAGVIARRYFFPLISDMPSYRALPSASPRNLPVARAAAARVLCLPIFPDMDEEQQMRVISVIRSCIAARSQVA